MSTSLSLLIFTIFVCSTHASLTLISDPQSKTLLQYGYGQATQNFLLRSSTPVLSTSAYLETSSEEVITSHEITASEITDTMYNVTATLNFEGYPGKAAYRIVVQTLNENGNLENHEWDGSHEVYGVVLHETNRNGAEIRSGDAGEGLIIETSSRTANIERTLEAVVYPPEASVSDAIIRVSHSAKEHVGILSEKDIVLSSRALTIRPDKSQLRSGRAFVHVEVPSIQVDGESFETVAIVTTRD